MFKPFYHVNILYPKDPQEGGDYRISYSPPETLERMEAAPTLPDIIRWEPKGEHNKVFPSISKGETQCFGLREVQDWEFGEKENMRICLVEPIVLTSSHASFHFELSQFDWHEAKRSRASDIKN
jgi:hypothetical protein